MIREPVGDCILALHLLDWGQHTVGTGGKARCAQGLDSSELRRGWCQSTKRARRPLGAFQPFSEKRGAALDGRRGIVELVGQSGGQFSERDHLLVVQAARCEGAAAIEHLMNEDGRDLVTIVNQRRDIGARYFENFRRLLGDRITRRTDQAGVGKHAADVSAAPFHDLVPSGPAIDIDGDVTGEQDEKARYGHSFCAQYLSFVQPAQRAVRSQPLQLRAWRCSQGLVLGETVDEVSCCHRGRSKRYEAVTRGCYLSKVERQPGSV